MVVHMGRGLVLLSLNLLGVLLVRMYQRGVVVLVLVVVRPMLELPEWTARVVVRHVVMVVRVNLTGMGVFVLVVAHDDLADRPSALLGHGGSFRTPYQATAGLSGA
jgi:hypothetical protein